MTDSTGFARATRCVIEQPAASSETTNPQGSGLARSTIDSELDQRSEAKGYRAAGTTTADRQVA